MNQSKFTLADVLTLIAGLAFGFICFLGSNFYTLGNIPQSIILWVIIFVLMVGTALGAKWLKRASRNFKTCFVWEMILLVLFTGITIFFSYTPFPHFFVVSEQRPEIKSKLIASITQAEDMFVAYERYAENRIGLYNKKLVNVAAAKSRYPSEYAAYGFEKNSVSDATQIENKMFAVRADLFPTNYEEMKQVASDWLTNERKKLSNWSWFRHNIGIVSAANDVEKKSENWLNSLIELSLIREKGEDARNFSYNLTFDDVKIHFLKSGKPNWPSIGFATLTYLLMLLSWFVTKVDFRRKGALTTAPYEVVL